MNSICKNKVGLALGSFLGLWHLMWSVLVALGLAQPLINQIFRLHFIEPPYTIASFNLGMALMLVGVTFLVGYLMGWVLAALWNWFQPLAQNS